MPIFSFIVHTLMKSFRKSGNWQQICKQMNSTFYISKDVPLKTCCKEKVIRTSLLERYYLPRFGHTKHILGLV